MTHSRLLSESVRAVASFVLVFAFLVGSFAPAFAIGGTNGTLTGTVVDATTKAPLRGVTVTVTSAAISQKTTRIKLRFRRPVTRRRRSAASPSKAMELSTRT